MKKVKTLGAVALVTLSAASVSAASAPDGYEFVTTSGAGDEVYIGAIKPTFWESRPHVEAVEYTIWTKEYFWSKVVRCSSLDVIFDIELNSRGEKHTSDPRLVQEGTVGYKLNTWACNSIKNRK
jgi:hypothetical protein